MPTSRKRRLQLRKQRRRKEDLRKTRAKLLAEISEKPGTVWQLLKMTIEFQTKYPGASLGKINLTKYSEYAKKFAGILITNLKIREISFDSSVSVKERGANLAKFLSKKSSTPDKAKQALLELWAEVNRGSFRYSADVVGPDIEFLEKYAKTLGIEGDRLDSYLSGTMHLQRGLIGEINEMLFYAREELGMGPLP